VSDADIWSRHSDELIRYATVLVGPASAEDVVSTVVLRVLQRRALSDLENPRPYLFKGVLNEARTLASRNSHHVALTDDAVSPPDVNPELLAAVPASAAQSRRGVLLVLARPSDRGNGPADGLPGRHGEAVPASGASHLRCSER
jgi:DNA-directed RNA polymerase specialized sigma24 family protein